MQKASIDSHVGVAQGTPDGTLLYNMMKMLPIAVYTCDIHGNITWYNESAAALWGRHPIPGEDLWCGSFEIFHPDGSAMTAAQTPMAQCIREQRPVNDREMIIGRPDGTRVYVHPQPQPIFDDNGTLIGAVNMVMDISEKKSKDQAIDESEGKYRALSESLAQQVEDRTATLKKSEERYFKMVEEVEDYAILLLDRDGIVLNWNKGAENIKGYAEKEIVGKHFRQFYLPHDREDGLPEKLIAEAVSNGKAMHEGWRLRKDGTKFWGYIVITALHGADGEIIGFSKVTRDLTERKIAEDQLQNYARSIEVQNEQLEEYAHITSHDLQEPLRKIHIFAGIVEENIDNKATVAANLAKIKAAASRMGILIQDILKYSKLSQKEDLFELTNLDKLIENVLSDLDQLIIEKQARIDVPPMPVISGIPVQLHQLFFNLIGNALKFSAADAHIRLSSNPLSKGEVAKFPDLDPSVNYVCFSVADNGIGFDQQYADKVFKLFQRLGDAKTGTGIGLALCKRIVENHKGSIYVESKEGLGSTFYVILPYTGPVSNNLL